MRMTSEFTTTVFAFLGGEVRAVPAGLLHLEEDASEVVASRFGFGSRYLQRSNAVPLDTSALQLEAAVAGSQKQIAPPNGLTLFGAVRDALPDLWGRRVIENKLNVPANSLRESEYMQHAGSNRLGALDFRPTPDSDAEDGLLVPVTDLRYLLDAADKVQRGERIPESLMQLFHAGPTMGGARPKAVVVRDNIQYLAKFPALGDGFNVPVIERATLELARACGLDVPQTEVVRMPDDRDIMLIERFDRSAVPGGWARKPVVSALTVLELHESESPHSSYAALSDRMGRFAAHGRVNADRAELFGRMVFNILVSNDDDHLRNHALIWMPKARGWALSPLYDVLPKPQMAIERHLHLGVGKQGRLATLTNAMSESGRFGLTPNKAKAIIERISAVVREWRTVFNELGVSDTECDKVASAFRKPHDMGLDAVLD
jgi:serine/threonine-protein kinase HipA